MKRIFIRVLGVLQIAVAIAIVFAALHARSAYNSSLGEILPATNKVLNLSSETLIQLSSDVDRFARLFEDQGVPTLREARKLVEILQDGTDQTLVANIPRWRKNIAFAAETADELSEYMMVELPTSFRREEIEIPVINRSLRINPVIVWSRPFEEKAQGIARIGVDLSESWDSFEKSAHPILAQFKASCTKTATSLRLLEVELGDLSSQRLKSYTKNLRAANVSLAQASRGMDQVQMFVDGLLVLLFSIAASLSASGLAILLLTASQKTPCATASEIPESA